MSTTQSTYGYQHGQTGPPGGREIFRWVST
jgi:hypothetical protein